MNDEGWGMTLVWLHVENDSGQKNEGTSGEGTRDFWIGGEG